MKVISANGIKVFGKSVKKFVSKNAPQILAGIGLACGLGATATAIRGTINAVDIVKKKEEEKGEKLTKKEIVKSVWMEYIPTVALSGASVACVVGSVNISVRRLATMGMAYAMSEKSLEEYKAKAKDILGEKKEEELRGSIAQDFIDANPPEDRLIRRTRGGTTLCLDRLSGQYFYSDADTIKRAINELNRLMLNDYFVSLNDLYNELEIGESKFGDNFGWNAHDGDLIEPAFTSELAEDGTPVLVMDFIVNPRPNFRSIDI